jgi:hypothetical protein
MFKLYVLRLVKTETGRAHQVERVAEYPSLKAAEKARRQHLGRESVIRAWVRA